MTRPWKPIEDMTHDEVRRYATDLLNAWASSQVRTGEFMDRLHMVSDHMEKLGVPKPFDVTVKAPCAQ